MLVTMKIKPHEILNLAGLRDNWLLLLIGIVFAASDCLVASEDEPGYLRSPAVYGDRVFFTAEGDLWTATVAGGEAQRLTSHPGEEIQVTVSPDGRQLAFAASYDGPVEAYVMPVDGGLPKRVSFDGGQIDVLGWTPDGRVVFASRNVSGPPSRRGIRLVDPDTLIETDLPMLDANQAAVDPASGRVVFTRFGLRITGDHVRHYRGGAMAQLWAMESTSATTAIRLIPDLDANADSPMWWDGRIYFLSDRVGIDNIWSMNPGGTDLQQHTDHQDFEVRDPALRDGRIVYQLGADLRVLDLASGADRVIPVQLVGDFDLQRQRWIAKPLDYLESASLSPTGDQVALTARGRVVLAAPGPLRRVELTTAETSRVRSAVFGVNGEWVYAISDASGQDEIWRFPANGKGEGKQLTDDGSTRRWRLYPSPDGRYLAHDDKNADLWLLDLASGKNRKIYSLPEAYDDAYGPLAWSADGKHVAFACLAGPRQMNQIVMVSLDDGGSTILTSDRYESFSPAFSPDGHWLYFLSERNFQAYPTAPWGDRNFGPAFDRRGQIYALALQDGIPFPFQRKNELQLAIEAPDDADADDAPVPAIEAEGLAGRLYVVPVGPGNYRALNSGKDRLYLLDQAAGPDQQAELKTIEITDEAPKPETFMAGVSSYALSEDGKKIFILKEGDTHDMYILDAAAKAPDDLGPGTVRVSDWTLPISPQAEWQQIFSDAWRMHQQFSFDPDMRGLDWNAVREKYEPLLERVTDRRELNDLLGQMIGELNILHSQVRSRDLPSDSETAAPSSLAAEFMRTKEGLQITHIYRYDPELPALNGPLLQPGIDVEAGDVITAINGAAIRTQADLAMALEQQAGQQVLLDYQRGKTYRSAIVTPVSVNDAARLRYLDWVQKSASAVAKNSDGRIGYLHLSAMGGQDIENFVREFYANYDREGLILDVRSNRGGSIDSWVIEKLLRQVWMHWQSSGGRKMWRNMQQTFRGHLVVLIDQFTYSDGETFAAGIKSLEIAPLIGTTTAGAGIWLSDRNALSDGGIARIAEYAQFDTSGRWLIEGRGIDPDIEVDNSPGAAYRGEDQQLDTAIDYLKELLAREPVPTLEGQQRFPLDEPGNDIGQNN